jgi:CheY-like chemotaxis protein
MSPPPSPTGTVLVIEDDADTRETLCEFLEGQGFTALCAGDGDAALRLLKGLPGNVYRPCAILLDLKMPGMDGWAFLRELRTNHYLKNIPVFVVSGADEESIPRDVAGRFEKPVDHDALLAAVTALCGPAGS